GQDRQPVEGPVFANVSGHPDDEAVVPIQHLDWNPGEPGQVEPGTAFSSWLDSAEGLLRLISEREGNPMALQIHVQHDTGDAVAAAYDFSGVGNGPRPLQVRQMHQAIDARFEF